MKLSKAFAVASFVAGLSSVLAVGCGGSSSEYGAASDSGASKGADGSFNGDAAPGAACTSTMGCDSATQDCCANLTGTSTCVAKGTCIGATIGCSGSASCPSGDVCCGTFSGSIQASCQAACTGGVQLCGSMSECPNNVPCQMFGGYGVCTAFTVDGGFSLDGGFFDFDASGLFGAKDSGGD